MTITVRAVYQEGLLRPLEPLPLAEGETVEVTLGMTESVSPAARPRTPEEEVYDRRLKAAKTLDEVLSVIATAPPLPADYDLCAALDANREITGERPLYPRTKDEGGS